MGKLASDPVKPFTVKNIERMMLKLPNSTGHLVLLHADIFILVSRYGKMSTGQNICVHYVLGERDIGQVCV